MGLVGVVMLSVYCCCVWCVDVCFVIDALDLRLCGGGCVVVGGVDGGSCMLFVVVSVAVVVWVCLGYVVGVMACAGVGVMWMDGFCWLMLWDAWCGGGFIVSDCCRVGFGVAVVGRYLVWCWCWCGVL